jgi:hypothetical protein
MVVIFIYFQLKSGILFEIVDLLTTGRRLDVTYSRKKDRIGAVLRVKILLNDHHF